MTKRTPAETDELLAEARDRMQLCIDASAPSRKEALDDFRFVGGKQWPDDMARQREIERRPCLTNNKLPTFVHQVVNEQRLNRMGIKVHPVSDGADEETAEVIQGLIRHIEYASNADTAKDTAVEHAIVGGFGYFRLGTDYSGPKSFEQDIVFRRIQNPFTVYVDPLSNLPDGSDMEYCFVTDQMSRAEFKRRYPKAEASQQTNLVRGAGDTLFVWLSQETVSVVEYYKVKREAVKLLSLSNGLVLFEDELPEIADPDVYVLDERDSERRTVCWYKITGVDVLEETVIKCDWIPLIPVYGDENLIDGRIVRSGLVRWSKDPLRMYNFWMTSATEEVSLRPKTPFIGAVGQFETAKKDWRQANTRSFAFLEYDPVDVNGIQTPPPQRQQMADVPTGVLAMAMHANDNVKACMGLFDASLGNKGTATSGIQERSQQGQSDKATFHYGDNLSRSIRQAGRCIVSMIPHYYNAARVVRILGEDEQMASAEINTPMDPKRDESGAIKTVLNDLTVGAYDITVGTGPSYSTKRQEAVESMLEAGRAYPPLWQAAGDKIVRAMDWPDADEIAKRLERTIPPEIRDEPQDGEQQQLPPQVMQVLQQAQGEIQQLQQALQESQSGMEKARLDAESKAQLAQLDAQVKLQLAQMSNASAEAIAAAGNDTKQDVAELNGLIQVLLQKMQPPPELAAAVGEDLAEESKPTAEEVG